MPMNIHQSTTRAGSKIARGPPKEQCKDALARTGYAALNNQTLLTECAMRSTVSLTFIMRVFVGCGEGKFYFSNRVNYTQSMHSSTLDVRVENHHN